MPTFFNCLMVVRNSCSFASNTVSVISSSSLPGLNPDSMSAHRMTSKRLPRLNCIRAGLLQYPLSHWNDQARLLGQRNELIGRHKTFDRMSPSDQCFHRTDQPCFGVDDGLIMQFELLTLNGRSKLNLHEAARIDRRHHLRGEEFKTATRVRFGLVKCQVRLPQEFAGYRPVFGSQRNTNTCPNIHGITAEIEGTGQQFLDPQRQGDCRLPLIVRGRLKDGEFVATEPCDDVCLPYRRFQLGRDLLE